MKRGFLISKPSKPTPKPSTSAQRPKQSDATPAKASSSQPPSTDPASFDYNKALSILKNERSTMKEMKQAISSIVAYASPDQLKHLYNHTKLKFHERILVIQGGVMQQPISHQEKAALLVQSTRLSHKFVELLMKIVELQDPSINNSTDIHGFLPSFLVHYKAKGSFPLRPAPTYDPDAEPEEPESEDEDEPAFIPQYLQEKNESLLFTTKLLVDIFTRLNKQNDDQRQKDPVADVYTTIKSCISFLMDIPNDCRDQFHSQGPAKEDEVRKHFESFAEWNIKLLFAMINYYYDPFRYPKLSSTVNNYDSNKNSHAVHGYTAMQDRTISIIELLSTMAGLATETPPQSFDDHIKLVNHGVAIIAMSKMFLFIQPTEMHALSRVLDGGLKQHYRAERIAVPLSRGLSLVFRGKSPRKLHRAALQVCGSMVRILQPVMLFNIENDPQLKLFHIVAVMVRIEMHCIIYTALLMLDEKRKNRGDDDNEDTAVDVDSLKRKLSSLQIEAGLEDDESDDDDIEDEDDTKKESSSNKKERPYPTLYAFIHQYDASDDIFVQPNKPTAANSTASAKNNVRIANDSMHMAHTFWMCSAVLQYAQLLLGDFNSEYNDSKNEYDEDAQLKIFKELEQCAEVCLQYTERMDAEQSKRVKKMGFAYSSLVDSDDEGGDIRFQTNDQKMCKMMIKEAMMQVKFCALRTVFCFLMDTPDAFFERMKPVLSYAVPAVVLSEDPLCREFLLSYLNKILTPEFALEHMGGGGSTGNGGNSGDHNTNNRGLAAQKKLLSAIDTNDVIELTILGFATTFMDEDDGMSDEQVELMSDVLKTIMEVKEKDAVRRDGKRREVLAAIYKHGKKEWMNHVEAGYQMPGF